MTLLPNSALLGREVLLAHKPEVGGSRWLCEIDAAIRPSGFAVCRAHSGTDTIKRVERGGLAAAVVVADDRCINGLSVLRIIRSIDRALPCWLVTGDPTRQTLQSALSLEVVSVMSEPVTVNQLTIALRCRLAN